MPKAKHQLLPGEVRRFEIDHHEADMTRALARFFIAKANIDPDSVDVPIITVKLVEDRRGVSMRFTLTLEGRRR